MAFPFLFGGTFIEGRARQWSSAPQEYFPSFSEGLSLREELPSDASWVDSVFPFLFGGTFIEGVTKIVEIAAAVLISLPFRRDFH